MAEMAGFRLPIESVALQALVSEPIKPCMDVVVMANTVHGYMSQSDKGEMVIGGGADGYNNYTSAAPSTTSRKRCARWSRPSR
jgi:sarcosine oxidase, subunit beta